MRTADAEKFWWNEVYFHTWRRTPEEVISKVRRDSRHALLHYTNPRRTPLDEGMLVQIPDSSIAENSIKSSPPSREVSLSDTCTFPELTMQLLQPYLDIGPFIENLNATAKPSRSLVVYGATEIISSYFLSYVLVRRLMGGLKTVIQSGENGLYIFDDSGVSSLKFMDCNGYNTDDDDVWVLCQNHPASAVIECFPKSFKLLAFPKRCADETAEFCQSHCPSKIEIGTNSGHAIALCAETIMQADSTQLGRLLELKGFYNSFKTEQSAQWNVEILISPWKTFYQELFERQLTEKRRPCTVKRIIRKIFKTKKCVKEVVRLHRPPRDIKHFQMSVSQDATIKILD